MISNVLFLFFCVESGYMNKGKTPLDSHTPRETSEVSMFYPEIAWREVSNANIWRTRNGESIRDYRERMHMVKAKADRVCYDLDLDLNELHRLSESRKNVEPEEEGELYISDGVDVVTEPLKERILPDPPLVETEVQSESDIEMWEPKREPPTYVEISSEDESGNLGSHYDLYGYGTGFHRGWSDEEDPEEDVEEVPINYPRNSDSESEEAHSNSSSDSGEDADDEDFDLAGYDESADTWDAWC